MVSVTNVTTGAWGSYTAFTRGQAIFQGASPVYEKQVQKLRAQGFDEEAIQNLLYPYRNASTASKVAGFGIETLIQFGLLYAAGQMMEFLVPKNLPEFVEIPVKVIGQLLISTLALQIIRHKLYIPHLIPYLVRG